MPISSRSILILSSHLRLGLPKGLFPVGLPYIKGKPGIQIITFSIFIDFSYIVIPSNQIHMWINSVGLIMAALPESYWSVLHDRLVEVMTCPQLTQWKYRNTPFQLFNFAATHDLLLENKFSYTLALAHSMWHHAGVGQISTVPQ